MIALAKHSRVSHRMVGIHISAAKFIRMACVAKVLAHIISESPFLGENGAVDAVVLMGACLVRLRALANHPYIHAVRIRSLRSVLTIR